MAGRQRPDPRWYNPLFGTRMRIENRAHAAEQGMAAARDLLDPDARNPFAPVPYFWSDQYDMKIQASGCLRGQDQVAVVEGDPPVAAGHRGGQRLGMMPWRERPRWRILLE